MATSKREILRRERQERRLMAVGFSRTEADSIRRISRTLSVWGEHECNGDIQRDETTDRPRRVFDRADGSTWGFVVPDRERGAIARLEIILAAHTGWTWHYQTDPRGAAVYLIAPDDAQRGRDFIESNYSTYGICVY